MSVLPLGVKAESEDLRDKSVRLFSFLKEYTELRIKAARTTDVYDDIVWLGEIPQIPGCFCAALQAADRESEIWIELKKPKPQRPPQLPSLLVPWINPPTVADSALDRPDMYRSVPGSAENSGEEESWLRIEDHPEVLSAFERYVSGPWASWAQQDRPIQQAQKIYNQLFGIYLRQQRLGEAFEVVLGLGYLVWKTPSGHDIRRHLVVAQTDIQFEAAKGNIIVRAAADGAKPVLEQDMLDPQDRPGLDEQALVEETLEGVGDDIFFDQGISAALKIWVHGAAATGQFVETVQRQAQPNTDPVVHLAPALLVRRRTDRSILRAIQEILANLKIGGPIPEGVERLVAILDRTTRRDDGADASESGDDGEYYFPLPANEEQMDILRRLRGRQGVLVQGPPGTGKSHTIANLVCHLLAKGERVLVTSHAARALEVLRQKIPKEVRALAVLLLGNDVPAMESLRGSVQGISARHSGWDPAKSQKAISRLEANLNKEREAEAGTLQRLRSMREQDSYRHPPMFGSYSGTAQAIATRLAQQEQTLGWLRGCISTEDEPPLTNREAIDLLRLVRDLADARVAELDRAVPASKALAEPALFEELVRGATRASLHVQELGAIADDAAWKPLLAAAPQAREGFETALAAFRSQYVALLRHPDHWVRTAAASTASGRQGRWIELHRITEQALSELQASPEAAFTCRVRGVRGRDLSQVQTDAAELLRHLDLGHGMGIGPFKAEIVRRATYLIRDVTVDGRPCSRTETLGLLVGWLKVQEQIDRLSEQWKEYAVLPGESATLQVAEIMDLHRELKTCLEVGALYRQLVAAAGDIGGMPRFDFHIPEVLERLVTVSEAVKAQHALDEIDASIEVLKKPLSAAARYKNAHSIVQELIQAVASRDPVSYSSAYERLTALEEQRSKLRQRREYLRRLSERSSVFAERLMQSASEPAWEDRLAKFEEAWNWARAEAWLADLGDAKAQLRLLRSLDDHRLEIGRLTRDLSSEKAWALCLKRLTEHERTHLKAWETEVQKIGKGTGKYAAQHRRNARKYMQECRGAIPAWIMPIYRVAETVDVVPDAFDVVIVDEASQSGPEALFLQYLAKTMIVVGDDQQISPDNVGIDREAVALLGERHLKGIPLHEKFNADTSFFDHASMRYGDSIMLREHFRCMPEIIQFSNNLCYRDRPLLPLRQFGAGRLTPVIVTKHVGDGYTEGNGNVNKPEADAVVAQIEACCSDRAYSGKSMGVISLVGSEQAKYIEKQLTERIGAQEIESRRIVCGDAYAFQGDERDVMFLSLVQAPREGRSVGALSDERAKRRFNVAASRARDQMWLFHTATLNDLNPQGMPYRLLEYCLNPHLEPLPVAGLRIDEIRRRAADPHRTDSDPPPPFGSWFEIDVFLRIVERGYRVIPQYEMAGYRIDLMVEGIKGRLAVECDGDLWHGEEHFDADAGRQRVLERCGLHFSRIRGTTFYRNPESAMEDVWTDLRNNGIWPGAEESHETPPDTDGQSNEPADGADETAGAAEFAPPPARPHEGPERGTPLSEVSTPAVEEIAPATGMAPYRRWNVKQLPDPRSASPARTLEGLRDIVMAEGPIICERLFQLYIAAAGLLRVGGVLRESLLKALQSGRHKGIFETSQELNQKDPLAQVVRMAGSPVVHLRTRGDRDLKHVPAAELGALMAAISSGRENMPKETLFRAVLTQLEVRRLTDGTAWRLEQAYRRYYRARAATGLGTLSQLLNPAPPPLVGHAIPPLESISRYAMTSKGLDKVKNHLNDLIAKQRDLEGTVEHVGDIAKSAGRYMIDDIEVTRTRIAELSQIVKEAIVIPDPTSNDRVEFGSRVTINAHAGRESYRIVGEMEGDASAGLVSIRSSLGKATYGRRVGDSITVNAPGGSYRATIVGIGG